MKTKTHYFIMLTAAFLWGCSREEKPHGHVHGPSCNHGKEDAHEHDDSCTHGDEENTIHVKQAVQKLLGLTCVIAEPRNIHGTVRFPGRFEVKPSARRVYSAIFEGVAQAHVQPYQRVAEGDVLFRLVSPAWVQQSGQLREAEAALALAQAEAQVLSERLERLREAGVRNAELDMALKLKFAEVARAEVTLKNAAEARQAVLALCREEDGALTVMAHEAGVVERVAVDAGAWTQAGTEIVSVVREDGVWFRADGLLSELADVRDGLRGFVSPVRPSAEKAEGELTVAWSADAELRTRPLYLTLDEHPPWVAPGVLGVLNIIVETSAENAVAIPLSCVVEDRAERIVFVRDAHDGEAFIRTEISLGASDGEWVEVSGVEAGAEVVLHGAYELKRVMPSADGAGVRASGHFHADGQFHEGGH